MFLVKRLLFGYLIILYFNVQPSIQADDDQSKSSEKSVASGLSEDVGKLNETVTNVVEDYSESDSEDSGTPEEKREKRMKRKFEKVAEREFQKAQKVVDKQYSKFVKGTFESLDLVDFATEHLKRFWFTGQCRFCFSFITQLRRNYELKCPKGWTETDGFCKAPLDYTGLCKDSVDFTDFGPREKEDFAWRCEAEWPCINEKPLFEGFECPFEWAPISDSLCLAPKTYEGMCPPILDVSKFDVRKKSLYERKCNVRWSRVSSKNLSQRLDKGQLKENTVSGIIDDGIIRLL